MTTMIAQNVGSGKRESRNCCSYKHWCEECNRMNTSNGALSHIGSTPPAELTSVRRKTKHKKKTQTSTPTNPRNIQTSKKKFGSECSVLLTSAKLTVRKTSEQKSAKRGDAFKVLPCFALLCSVWLSSALLQANGHKQNRTASEFQTLNLPSLVLFSFSLLLWVPDIVPSFCESSFEF